MKKTYKIVLIILSMVLLSCLLVSIYYSRVIDKIVLNSENNIIYNKKPKYHFVAIIKKSDEPYWIGVEKGINETAQRNNAAMEVNYTDVESGYSETLKYIDMAISSQVEGIITVGYDTKDFCDLVDKAFQKGIPVITIDSDSPKSRRTTFVGINDYEFGALAGKQVLESMKDNANVAVLLDNSDEKISNNGEIMVQGLKDAVKSYINVKIHTVNTSDYGILGAKNVLQDIVNSKNSINIIVCTSANDSIGIAQQTVDFNMVGRLVIVAYDDSDEILKYVEKGVIYSTLIPNPVNIGIKGVESLVEIKERGGASSYLQTDINVVNKNNVNSYIHNIAKGRAIKGK